MELSEALKQALQDSGKPIPNTDRLDCVVCNTMLEKLCEPTLTGEVCKQCPISKENLKELFDVDMNCRELRQMHALNHGPVTRKVIDEIITQFADFLKEQE